MMVLELGGIMLEVQGTRSTNSEGVWGTEHVGP